MKKTLLITAVIGWLTLSQTVHADSVATAAAPVDENARVQSDAQPANYQLAQVIHADASSLHATTESTVSSPKSGMPSVPIGLAGLLVMICVLVKRRNDPN